MQRYDTFYKVKAGDNLGDPGYWNNRLQDIDVRLNAVESFTADINAAVDTVTTAGIDRINTTLTPAITALQNSVTTAQDQVTALQGTVLTDQGNITAQLNSLLAEAQGLVDELEGTGTIDGGTF